MARSRNVQGCAELRELSARRSGLPEVPHALPVTAITGRRAVPRSRVLPRHPVSVNIIAHSAGVAK
eukprot:15431043-Alexandrium_andersonii.AAC.1